MTYKTVVLVKPDADLGKIIGIEPEFYTTKLKRLWVYMRAHSLTENVPNPKYVAKVKVVKV